MLLIGGDFWFDEPQYTSGLIDLLTRMMSASKNIEYKFSTPSAYFSEVFKSKPKFGLFEGDMLPLIDKGKPQDTVWTGFYSTKPYLKNKISQVQRKVRIAEILETVVMNRNYTFYNLATTSHHDAITGTADHSVHIDYLSMLSKEDENSLKHISESIQKLLKRSKKSVNIGEKYKVMVVFNPLSWEITKTLDFLCEYSNVKILDSNGKAVLVQAVPWEHSYKFFFRVTLKAFGFKVMFIIEKLKKCEGCSVMSDAENNNELKNENLNIIFESGLIKTLVFNNKKFEFNTKIINYSTKNSGIYTFNPQVIII